MIRINFIPTTFFHPCPWNIIVERNWMLITRYLYVFIWLFSGDNMCIYILILHYTMSTGTPSCWCCRQLGPSIWPSVGRSWRLFWSSTSFFSFLIESKTDIWYFFGLGCFPKLVLFSYCFLHHLMPCKKASALENPVLDFCHHTLKGSSGHFCTFWKSSFLYLSHNLILVLSAVLFLFL